jgi:hypothetical protein
MSEVPRGGSVKVLQSLQPLHLLHLRAEGDELDHREQMPLLRHAGQDRGPGAEAAESLWSPMLIASPGDARENVCVLARADPMSRSGRIALNALHLR